MWEIVGNLHLHTDLSDGAASHEAVAAAARQAGLDFIIYTDHNTTRPEKAGWYQELLCLMGQEIHDTRVEPSVSHLLGYMLTDDLQHLADQPQRLIDTIAERGGLSFLAHPLERPGFRPEYRAIPWQHWPVSGYTGLELWNAMSEIKWRLRSLPRGIAGAYLPAWVLTGPFPETLSLWDELLAKGDKIVAIGGADAHGKSYRLGPLNRVIYPYAYLFRAVNTHLLLPEPLARDLKRAGQQIRAALAGGHCFVGCGLDGSPRGFRFTAISGGQKAMMGDSLAWSGSAMLQAVSPRRARIRLLRNGRSIAETTGRALLKHITEPGIYRVEAYRRRWGQWRGWVFTNPIYITP